MAPRSRASHMILNAGGVDAQVATYLMTVMGAAPLDEAESAECCCSTQTSCLTIDSDTGSRANLHSRSKQPNTRVKLSEACTPGFSLGSSEPPYTLTLTTTYTLSPFHPFTLSHTHTHTHTHTRTHTHMRARARARASCVDVPLKHGNGPRKRRDAHAPSRPLKS